MDEEESANSSANDNEPESTGSNDANESETAAESNISTSERPDPSDNLIMDEDNQSPTSQAHDFDLTLPASHSYLGSNLEELRGRTFLDEGLYINFPLLVEQSIVLFPGQTLPMAVFDAYVIDMLDKCIQTDRTFGVVCAQRSKFESIGTTAEIYEYIAGSSREGFRIKAKGRQRFKIVKITRAYNEMSANVKIIPEINLPHPFLHQRLACLDHFRVKPTNKQELKRQNKVEMLDSVVTCWPSWVYKQYDPHRLVCKIHEQLQFIETRVSCIPTDPTDLSFWVGQNIPLSNRNRLMLLKYDCAIPRLQWELKYLVEDRVLICINCGSQIAQQSKIFPMSKEGPQNTFCNSGGFIHDTVTLYEAVNLRLNQDQPSTHYSWFPGYAWTIASCEGCKIHMGWLFTAHEDETLRPQVFWGLTRSHLKSMKLSSRNKQSSNTSEQTSQDTNQTDSEEEYQEEEVEEEEEEDSLPRN